MQAPRRAFCSNLPTFLIVDSGVKKVVSWLELSFFSGSISLVTTLLRQLFFKFQKFWCSYQGCGYRSAWIHFNFFFLICLYVGNIYIWIRLLVLKLRSKSSKVQLEHLFNIYFYTKNTKQIFKNVENNNYRSGIGLPIFYIMLPSESVSGCGT